MLKSMHQVTYKTCLSELERRFSVDKGIETKKIIYRGHFQPKRFFRNIGPFYYRYRYISG